MESTLLDPSQIKPTKDGYNNLQEQIEFGRFNSVMTGAAPALYQDFVSVEDQRLYKLSAGEFVVGDNSLQVYVNGQLMRIGEDNDYKEIDNRTIEFNFGLYKDDIVVMRVNGGKSGPSLYEKYLANNGQFDFTLASSYSTGNNSLVVYINGAYQTVNVDYQEIDSKTVKMLEPLEKGDIVVFRVEGLPSEESKHKDKEIIRTYDANNLLIKEESFGDGHHIIQEYFRDADGRPQTMTIKEAGYTKIRAYTWNGDNCTNIKETVVEVS